MLDDEVMDPFGLILTALLSVSWAIFIFRELYGAYTIVRILDAPTEEGFANKRAHSTKQCSHAIA
jgi:hypothetical protein